MESRYYWKQFSDGSRKPPEISADVEKSIILCIADGHTARFASYVFKVPRSFIMHLIRDHLFYALRTK